MSRFLQRTCPYCGVPHMEIALFDGDWACVDCSMPVDERGNIRHIREASSLATMPPVNNWVN